VLATQYRSEKIREGNSWDVTEQTEKSIEGYERVAWTVSPPAGTSSPTSSLMSTTPL
jgi:hypothetical protein